MELYVTHVLHRNRQRRPDQACLVDGVGVATHDEVAARVAALAGGLRASGVGAGDRVAIVAANSARYVEALFAILWAGAIACPVNHRLAPREVLDLLGGVGASAVFVDGTCPVPADGLRPGVRTVVDLTGGPGTSGTVPYEEMARSDAIPDSGRSGDDIALLLSTGGTTGRAKQAALSHANVVSAGLAQLAAGSGTGEVFVHVAPLFHLAGMQMMVTHLLGGGGPQAFLPRFTPDGFMAAVEAHRATDTLLVPTMLRTVLAAPARAGFDLTSLRRIFYGAAPMPGDLLEQAATALPSAGFVQGYGMTETLLTVTLPPEAHSAAARRRGLTRSVGRAHPGVDVSIRDAAGAELPTGEVGEIAVRGPSVMRGYYGDPDATREVVREGWLYTGDGGRMDAEGYLYLADRIKDMIVTGGENVFSVEVEDVLLGHPEVEQAAVIGIPDGTWGETVHAIVVAAPGAAARPAGIRDFCRERLAGYKCPRTVEFRDALPLSAAGKVLKAQLRAESSTTGPR
ncbi:MAG TPA: AMP-binding protein [Streptosporangiaceae bacterium]|jgi:acyl-CoA synthetase (AMP-forming)/AMP-acid ligase II